MRIVINDDNVVIGYSTGNGRVAGYVNIEVNDIPSDFVPYKYIYADGKYKLNPDYTAVDLDSLKVQKIAESKLQLAEWLNANPMQYTDGKYYSVTEEKQSLLNSNLASFERADSAGLVYPLKWNATGEECVEWEYSDLVALSLAIAGYVAPKVAAQQAVEIAINACETAEQLEAVVVDYA